jgi:hypothetical protein
MAGDGPGSKTQSVRLDRCGRIDSLDNAGSFIGWPFTDCTIEDHVAITARQPQ